MPQNEANWILLDDELKIQAYGLRKYIHAADDPMSTMIIGNKPIGHIETDIAPDTITEINIVNTTYPFFTKGDAVFVLDPETNRVVEQLVCSVDYESGDFIVEVDSQTINNALYAGYPIVLDSQKKIASQSVQVGSGNSYSFEKVLWCRTTNATITECTTDGLTGSGTSNRIIVPLDSAMTCEMTIQVKQSASANHRTYKRVATFVNNGGTVTMPEPVTTPFADYGTVALAACAVTVSANNTNDCIKVEFTGIAATNLNCSVSVKCNVSKYG